MATVLKLTPGVSEVIALKFDTGKNCEGKFGPQVQFSTVRDEIFWLDPEHASDVERELQRLGIRAGTDFRLTKLRTTHGGHRFSVERQPEGRAAAPEQGNAYREPAAARSAEAPREVVIAREISATPAAACMCAAMCAAVDAAIETQAYAQRKGLGLTFSEESVRAIGLSIYISACKGGR